MTQWTVEAAIPADVQERLNALSKGGNPTQNLFAFLNIIKQLKLTKRTGWLNFGIDDAESISDHMYRMGILGLFCQDGLDSGKCMKLALVHDMAEAVVGDITPADPVTKEEKHRRELDTMAYLRKLLEPFNSKVAGEIYDLWNEYENVSSPEARYIKDIDKFELMVQCLEEEKRYKKQKDLGVFMSVRSQIKTPEVSQWADEVIAEREAYWAQ